MGEDLKNLNELEIHETRVTKFEQLAQLFVAKSLHEAQREQGMSHQHYL